MFIQSFLLKTKNTLALTQNKQGRTKKPGATERTNAVCLIILPMLSKQFKKKNGKKDEIFYKTTNEKCVC